MNHPHLPWVVLVAATLVYACTSDPADTASSGPSASNGTGAGEAASNGSGAQGGSAQSGGSGGLGGSGTGGSGAWQPPIGIPAPPFGIHESPEMYTGQAGYEDAGSGPYTHYVDNTSPGCNDSSNGTQASPRCTVPLTLPAGSVVEVHGGPYPGNDVIWTLNGTPTQPVFIRGTDPMSLPSFVDRVVRVEGTYGVIELLDFDATRVIFQGSGSHDVALRFSFVHDHPGTGAFIANGIDYLVIFGNEIARNGVIPSSADHHGFFTGSGTDHIWVVDNHIHDNSGDAIQFCHGCWNTPPGPAYVYIGRNVLHDDEENAIDIKEALGPVVMSQNIMYGYEPGTFSGNGDALRINDEGTQGEIWAIYNVVASSTLCIYPSNNHSSGVFLIGNVLVDCGVAIGPDAGAVVNNTILNAQYGVQGGQAHGNLIQAATQAITSDVTSCSHNLVWQGTIASGAGCTSSVLADPLLALMDGVPAGLAANSPAIDAAGPEHPVYQLYQASYGLDIRVDVTGAARPQGVGWDIGAHEHP